MLNRIVIILFMLTLGLLFFLPPRDPDFGWHYRCGKELRTGKPCTSNTFSYYLKDYHAYYTSFVYDTFVSYFYDKFGFIGISVVGSLVLMTGAFFISQLIMLPLLFPLLIGAYYLSQTAFSLGLRPQVVSIVLFFLLIYLFNKAKKNIYYLLIIPLIMLLWVNTHIGFVVGLVTTCVFLIYIIVSRIKQKQYSNVILLSGIGILSLVSTIINPFGWRVYLELFRHAEAPLNTMIAEWVPPHPYHQVGIIIALVGIVLTHLIMKVRITPLTLLTGIFGFLSLSARRNLPLFYFSFILWLNEFRVIHAYIYRIVNKQTQVILTMYILMFIGILSISRISLTLQTSVSLEKYCLQGSPRYPCKAINKIPKNTKNLYTAYEWGGFVIWKKPEVKVFVDGRMSAWKDEKTGMYPYQTYLYILQTQKGWNNILAEYKTDTLLIMPGTFLDLELQKTAQKWGWKEIYRDDVE